MERKRSRIIEKKETAGIFPPLFQTVSGLPPSLLTLLALS